MEHPESTASNHISISLHHTQRASTDNLQRAARHYRRTLTTLRGSPFEHMPVSTRQKLVAHLTEGLHAVERELQRRGLEGQRHRAHALSDGQAGLPSRSVPYPGRSPSTDMPDEGVYELFETIQKHRILVLENRWYAWDEGLRGQVLVPTDDRPRRVHTLQQGRFVLADVDGESGMRLFLEREGRYEEHVLPAGVPAGNGRPHRIVETGRSVASSELEGYLKDLLSADLEDPPRPSRPQDGAMLLPIENGRTPGTRE